MRALRLASGLFLLFLTGASSPVHADTLVLENGDEINGDIYSGGNIDVRPRLESRLLPVGLRQQRVI